MSLLTSTPWIIQQDNSPLNSISLTISAVYLTFQNPFPSFLLIPDKHVSQEPITLITLMTLDLAVFTMLMAILHLWDLI